MSNQYIFYWQRRSFELILCSSQKKTTIECEPNKMIQSSFLFAKVETSTVCGFLSPISSNSQFLWTVEKSQFLQTVKKQSMAFTLRNISSIVYLGPVSPPSWLYFSDLFTVFWLIFTLNNIFRFSLISVVFLFSEKLEQFSKEAQFIPQSNERESKKKAKSSSEIRHQWVDQFYIRFWTIEFKSRKGGSLLFNTI